MADRRWRYGAGLAACGVLVWIGIVRASPIPLLAYVDLGFHELGHLVAAPLPDLTAALAGSLAQIGVPTGLAVYFLLRQRDLLAVGLCLTWAGTSARNVAIYVADAPFQTLPLIGGQHDWAYILAGNLGAAPAIAGAVTFVAWLLALGGMGACLLGLSLGPSPEARLERSSI